MLRVKLNRFDPDGFAISNLLVTLFFKLFPDVIKEGRLFRILTPLFIIKTKEKAYYCLDAKERDDVLKTIKGKYEIVRAKGLGETGVQVLKETGMDPKTRRVKQIVIEDIEKAKEMLEIVMGDDAALRKQWLEENPYKEDLE